LETIPDAKRISEKTYGENLKSNGQWYSRGCSTRSSARFANYKTSFWIRCRVWRMLHYGLPLAKVLLDGSVEPCWWGLWFLVIIVAQTAKYESSMSLWIFALCSVPVVIFMVLEPRVFGPSGREKRRDVSAASTTAT
jgi:hypothetical protein